VRKNPNQAPPSLKLTLATKKQKNKHYITFLQQAVKARVVSFREMHDDRTPARPA
jgi:hypothetical protein